MPTPPTAYQVYTLQGQRLTEGYLCSSYFNSVIKLSGISAELFTDKVSWTMLHSDLLTFIYIFSNEVLSKKLCTMDFFYSSSSVSLTFDDGAIYFS